MAKHQFVIRRRRTDARDDRLEFVCAFSPTNLTAKICRHLREAKQAAQKNWNHFWQTGGAIDLSGSKDPRWFELERRIVLSQYLTAIQDAGEYPPAETGLTYNTWEGKFHLEMHWWHEAHFALWNRLPLLEKSLGWYQNILPRAEAHGAKAGLRRRALAQDDQPQRRGIAVARRAVPHLAAAASDFLRRAVLSRPRRPRHAGKISGTLFLQTADFMASYATWDTKTKRYVLGPTLQCAQEIFPKNKTFNPTFELTYWRWGLETAQQWRQRLGLPRNEKWDAVLKNLAQPPVGDGKYLFAETAPDSYTNPRWNKDHPAVVGALSFVPGPGIDAETMRNTLDWVWKNWNWPDTWGWDYPMLAMTRRAAGRTGTGRGCAAARHAEKSLRAQRPGLSAARSDDLSAGQRRIALRRGDDGGRLGFVPRWAGRNEFRAETECARVPGQRPMERALGKSAPGAVAEVCFQAEQRERDSHFTSQTPGMS